MGCGCSSNGDEKIEMKKTNLDEIDEFFDQAQELVDSIYEIKDPLEEARENLLKKTSFWNEECANSTHAIVGTIYAISAFLAGDLEGAFDIKTEEPFLIIGDKVSSGPVGESCTALKEYIEVLLESKDKVQPLGDQAKQIANSAKELPKKTKEAAKNSSLGIMGK